MSEPAELESPRENAALAALRAAVPPVVALLICLAAVVLLLASLHYPRDEDVTFWQSLQEISRNVWKHAILPGRVYKNWVQTLRGATPLLLTGLAVTVAFRANVLNIGAQGQHLVGAVAGTFVGALVPLPAPLMIPAMLLAAMLAGAIFAAIASALEIARRVPVVLSTLLLNFVAFYLVTFVLGGPLRYENLESDKSRVLLLQAWLPTLTLGGESSLLHAGIFIALAIAILIAFLIRYTTFGFRLRAVGENPTAARFAGINVARVSLATLALSGSLAGLSGSIEVAGSVEHQILRAMTENGFGFTGIAVALLGRLSPLGVIASALFFGFLNTAFQSLQAGLQVPSKMTQSAQGLIIIAVLVLSHSRWLALLKRAK